jgi:hypothetical protein
MGLFGPKIRVHVLVKGRIGAGWRDVDRTVKLPVGMTLQQLIEAGDRYGLPLQEALENSPHLRDTLMWNGDRCPVAEHGTRRLEEGDQIYLLAPLAGG